MIKVRLLNGGTPDHVGLIPSFLDEEDPRSAKEQFAAKYIGGWFPLKNFEFNWEDGVLTYPGDPPMKPLAIMVFRDDVILVYENAWVNIVGKDKKFEVSRMD